MKARFKGFTLIELLVTVVIVAILASGALPMFQLSVQRAKEVELRNSLRQIREAIDAYKSAYDQGRISKTGAGIQLGVIPNGYPPNLAILAEGVVDANSPKKAKIKFLRRIPRDPMAENGDTPASETWGTRSYESDADNPKEGDDVYDVYSKSEQVGINGVPYKQW